MRHPHLASAIAMAAFLLVAVGSGGSKSGGGDEGGAAATNTASTGTGTGAASDRPTIIATCLNTKEGKCDEYYGFLPTLVPEFCPKEGGVFKKSADACPKENLTGTCHYKQSKKGEPGQYANFYSNNTTSMDAAKKDCVEGSTEANTKEWIEAPAAPKASAVASAAKPAIGAKPGAKPVTPAAKPAGSAKAK